MFTSYQLKKISQSALVTVCVGFSVTSLCSDYNGNILSPSKIVFNNNSSNSYIQNAMQKTVNFDGLIDQTFGTNQNLLGSTYLNSIAPDSNYNQCTSIALQADGKIVMGGYTYLNGTDSRFAAARLNADGSIDTTFGNNGSLYITAIALGSDYDECHSIALQTDGKIVMGGYTYLNGAHARFAAARLTTDGSPDTTFGDNGSMYLDAIAPGSTNDVCYSIALQADGKIVMGGYTNLNRTSYRFAAARLTTDGSPDTTFGDNGSMYLDAIAPGSTNDVCYSIAIQADGKIVMGGFTYLNGHNRFAAARLLPNGQLDETFGNGGVLYLEPINGADHNDACNSVAIQNDGKIVMGGRSQITVDEGNFNVFAAARILSNGQPDLTFGTNGSLFIEQIVPGTGYSQCFSIAIQSDQKIVMGGTSASNFAAARLNSDGSLDNTFGVNPGGPAGTMYFSSIAVDSNDDCQSIALQADGKIVMGGFTYLNNNFRFAAARLNTNGSPDSTFGSNPGGPVGTMYFNSIAPDSNQDQCHSIVIQSDDKIVMGGHTNFQDAHPRFAAARLNPNGSPDSSFGVSSGAASGTLYLDAIIPGNSNDDECYAIALQSNGKIVMGGWVDTDNGWRAGVAQLINPMTLQDYQESYATVGAGIYS